MLVGAVKENVRSILEKGLVSMHSAPIYPEDRLGHKGGIEAVSMSDLFDHNSVGHDIIGHGKGIGVSEVYFVLRRSHLMVTIFYPYPH